jgi:hypothetical protein
MLTRAFRASGVVCPAVSDPASRNESKILLAGWAMGDPMVDWSWAQHITVGHYDLGGEALLGFGVACGWLTKAATLGSASLSLQLPHPHRPPHG